MIYRVVAWLFLFACVGYAYSDHQAGNAAMALTHMMLAILILISIQISKVNSRLLAMKVYFSVDEPQDRPHRPF